jgi:hypothetical protein
MSRKEKSLNGRGATGIETQCLMSGSTGQVPYSTFQSSATRRLTSERLDLLWMTPGELGPNLYDCYNGFECKGRRKVWPTSDIRFLLMPGENASFH